MMSSFFFFNNFSTIPNGKIVGRSKLEAFAEEFKLRHKLFSVMIGWKTFKKKKGKLLLNSIFFFSLNVFFFFFFKVFHHQSVSFSYIQSLLMCHVSLTVSGSGLKIAVKVHKPDWKKFKIPIFCTKNRVTVCKRIKNENSDYLIVLKKDIWKTEYCQLYSFSEHSFARTFQLHLSGLKSFFLVIFVREFT